MKKIVFTKEQDEMIKKMYYEDLLSLEKISKYFGVSYNAIEGYFKRNKYKIRDCHEIKKYPFNEHYFDVIDDDSKAYWLGFLFADGCNMLNKRCVAISLQENDKEILDKFKGCLGLEQPLYYRKFDYADSQKGQNAYDLRINSIYLSERLNDLGMIPNKSLCLDYPNWMTKELLPSFLRGYIDGDGWVQQYRIGFMSSDKFCVGVQNALSEYFNIYSTVRDQNPNKYNSHTKILDITSRKNIIPLIDLMFKNDNAISLQRKKERYIKYFGKFINNSLVA